MSLPEVHVKKGSKIVEYHPRREFISATHRPIVEQDGRFWTANGRPLKESDVPPYIVEVCKARPKSDGDVPGVRVSKVCAHCGDAFLGDEYEQHLLAIIQEATSQGAGVEGLDG